MIVFRRFRWMYLSKLNAFVMRQLCCGINSSSISMGIICLMLLATIVSFVTGISVANQFQTGVREKTPADFSIVCTTGERVSDWFRSYGSPISTWAKEDYVEVPAYQIGSIRFMDTLGSGAEEIVEQYTQAIIFTEPVDIMRLSDFNNLMSRYGKEKMKLSGNEYRVACDWSMVLDYRNKALREKTPIRIGNVTLYPASDMCEEQFVIMSLVSFNAGTFIVPDNVIDAEQSEASISAYIAVGDYCAATTSQKKATD